MKKILLRVMPLAAAIVFATSCSKDKDEVKPEDVTPKESSVTMTFKVGSSAGLSKIGLIEDNGDFGVALKFDGNEVINFTDAEGRVTGSVTLTSSNLKNDGKTAEFNVSFKGKEENIEKFKAGDIKLTASIGSKLTEISSKSYSSLEDAIRANSYQLSNAPIAYSESLTEITFEEQTAYFEIGLPVKVEKVNINDKDISLNKGRGWIAIPVDTKVTSEALSLDNKEVTAAKIYSVYRKAFSVSASKKVHFSTGNLQYNLRTEKWRFALNQYDKCFLQRLWVKENYSGLPKENVEDYGLCAEGWTDLFGWGRWIKGQEPGTTPLDDVNYFPSINKEGDLLVGEAAIEPDWNTLEINEWAYLLYYRENADQKYGVATVCDVNGMVILPDDWTAPDGISFTPGMASTYGSAYYGENNKYDADTWKKMESAGAVFLPVTGILTLYKSDPCTVAYQKSAAYYWSSTSGDYYYYDTNNNNTNDYRADGDKHWYVSHEMEFSSVSVDVTRKSRRHYGCSVRLVRGLGGTLNSNKVIGNFGNVEEKW